MAPPYSLQPYIDVAEYPGVDTTGTAFSDAGLLAAFADAQSDPQPRQLRFRPGLYKYSATPTAQCINGPIRVLGAGNGNTVLQYTGAGDGMRIFEPTSPPGGWTGLSVYGGSVRGLTFDLSKATTGAVALHIGDGEYYQVDCEFRHANGLTGGPAGVTGSVGLWIDNSVWWTEKGRWRCNFIDCQNAVLQTNNSGNNSHAENDFDWNFFLGPGQNAITMVGIAHYLGRLRCRGVFNAGVSNGGVFLTADAASAINNCWLDVAVNGGQSGTFHQTANAATGFSFQSNYGRLLFNGGPWVAGSWGGATTSWANNQTACSFAGDILGDAGISGAAAATGVGPPQPAFIMAGNPVVYANGFFRASDGKINDFMGDFFGPITLSANLTVGLGGGTKGSVPGPQRKIIAIKQAAAGGPFTVTWPHNASPTTTTPKVVWAGGSAPVQTATASAIDVYELVTMDGATWYGRVVGQNMS